MTRVLDASRIIMSNQAEFDMRGINVKWHGAVGDGVTDDTQAINDAIDAAATAGVNVLFPPGFYPVSATIDMTTSARNRVGLLGLVYRGKGWHYGSGPTTIWKGATSGSGSVVLDYGQAAYSGFTVKNLSFEFYDDHLPSGITSAIPEIGIRIGGESLSDYAMDFVLENCHVQGASEDGVHLRNSWIGHLKNCKIARCKNGVNQAGLVNTVHFIDCRVFNNSEHGIRLHNTRVVNIKRCTLERNKVGINTGTGSMLINIEDGYFESSSSDTHLLEKFINIVEPSTEGCSPFMIRNCFFLSLSIPDALYIDFNSLTNGGAVVEGCTFAARDYLPKIKLNQTARGVRMNNNRYIGYVSEPPPVDADAENAIADDFFDIDFNTGLFFVPFANPHRIEFERPSKTYTIPLEMETVNGFSWDGDYGYLEWANPTSSTYTLAEIPLDIILAEEWAGKWICFYAEFKDVSGVALFNMGEVTRYPHNLDSTGKWIWVGGAMKVPSDIDSNLQISLSSLPVDGAGKMRNLCVTKGIDFAGNTMNYIKSSV